MRRHRPNHRYSKLKTSRTQFTDVDLDTPPPSSPAPPAMPPWAATPVLLLLLLLVQGRGGHGAITIAGLDMDMDMGVEAQMGSEAAHGRLLWATGGGRRYISYDALWGDAVLCPRPGVPYYN